MSEIIQKMPREFIRRVDDESVIVYDSEEDVSIPPTPPPVESDDSMTVNSSQNLIEIDESDGEGEKKKRAFVERVNFNIFSYYVLLQTLSILIVSRRPQTRVKKQP